METTDDKLVAAYVENGDERAFSELVERYQERIYGYLYGMVQDHDVANDLFQDTFMRAINAMQKRKGAYAHKGKWLPWIIRIARNAALDHFRSRKRWRSAEFLSDDGQDTMPDNLSDESPSADQRLSREERDAWLEKLIERLPREQREVLVLRHEAELSFKEIAALTDCSINTALGRMRYALLNLKKMLGADAAVTFTDIDARI